MKLQKVDGHLYREHIRSKTRLLQHALAPFKIKVFEPKGDKPFSNIEKGRMHSEQVDCMVKILKELVKDNKFVPNHIAIEALTMSGKTGLISLCSFLPVVIYLLTGEVSLLFRFLVDDTTLEQQAEEEGNEFLELYGDIVFSNVKEKYTLREYIESVKTTYSIDFPFLGRAYRNSRVQKDVFKEQEDYLLKKGIKILVFCDESHARSNHDSLLDQMLKANHVDWLKSGISFLGLSATNYALNKAFDDRNYPHITMNPGKNYTGFPWLKNNKLEISVPEVLSFDSFCLSSGIKYDFNNSKKVLIENADNFTLPFIEMVIHCLFKDRRGKGLLARIINNNRITEFLKEKLQKLLPEVKFIVHNPDEVKKFKKVLTLEEQIEEEAGKLPYVVLVTGRGRMGMIAPRNCKFGIDFSRKSDPQTLLQGIPGRMTGYFKGKTLLVLSNYNAKLLNNYIETGKWEIENEPISPYKRHLYIQKHCESYLIESTEFPLKLKEEIEKFIKTIAEVRNNRIYRGSHVGNLLPINLYNKIYKVFDKKGVKIEDYDGKVAVRLFKHEESTKEFVARTDSMSYKRSEPAFIVDDHLNLLWVRFKLKERSLNYELKKNVHMLSFSDE